MIRIIISAAAFLLLLAGCSQTNREGMNQFAQDSAFQAAHPSPDSIQFVGAGKMIEFPTPDGAKGTAYALLPDSASGKFLFVIHEWWGLNDHIKKEAERLFGELGNVTVLALDLYDGKVAANPEEAGQYMGATKEERLNAIVQGAIAYAGGEAEIATLGWCFGGGWSLRASILAGKQGAGCVMYYGMPVEKADQIAPLQAEVLGIFAKQDGWINEEVVSKFQSLAGATRKKVDVHWFDAAHAFANPSNDKYDAPAAEKANELALTFLRERLK